MADLVELIAEASKAAAFDQHIAVALVGHKRRRSAPPARPCARPPAARPAWGRSHARRALAAHGQMKPPSPTISKPSKLYL
ncbi:hypothetical protein GCM10009734_86690 [Nonomuraea bangladeshensis]